MAEKILTINGRLFRIRFTHDGIPPHDDGYCEKPVEPPGVAEIRIRPNLSRRRRRVCVIHELTHAARWSMSENFVEQFAEDLEAALTLLKL